MAQTQQKLSVYPALRTEGRELRAAQGQSYTFPPLIREREEAMMNRGGSGEDRIILSTLASSSRQAKDHS